MYKLNLTINNKEQEFTRNSGPNLKDVMNAMKVQLSQLDIYKENQTDRDKFIDGYGEKLAKFAADFWSNQFNVEDVINGSTLDSIEQINKAYTDTLQQNSEDDSGKKPRKKTSKKQ